MITPERLDRSHIIGKWVTKETRLKDKDGKLNAGVIDLDRIPGFSVNKIPSSKVSDLRIEFNKENQHPYLDAWPLGVNGVYPTRGHYVFLKTREFYFVRIKDLFGFQGEYSYPAGSDKKFKFELQLVHKPLMSNYFHFEFDIINDAAHGQIKKGSKGWGKLICSQIKDLVQEKAFFYPTNQKK